MVTLQEIFDLLSQGEIRSLALGGANTGGIAVADYSKVIPHVNLGLTALFTRFQLNHDEVYIRMFEHIVDYSLDAKFATSNTLSTEPIKYILDSTYKPFTGPVLSIREVYTEIGEKLHINDPNDPNSIYRMNHNRFRVSNPVHTNMLRVVFLKDHPRIPLNTVDASVVELDINYAMVEPLLFYVASRIHAGAGTVNGTNESTNYIQKYEISCMQLERRGLDQLSETTNLKAIDNGWV